MRAVVASIAVAATCLAAPVRADPTEAAALVHLHRGVAAFRARDFARAHREFEAARNLAPDRANPYRWLALTEVQIGDCRRAAANADAFLSRVAPGDARAAELVRVRELCRRTAVLRVDSSPSRAALRIDDAAVGHTPYRALSMPPGTYRLSADRDGYQRTERSIVLRPGADLAVSLELVARRPITRRWWFWTAVAAGAAAAVGTAVVLASRGDEAQLLAPVRCDATGCSAETP